MKKKKDSSRLVWYAVGGLALFGILWMATAPNAPAKTVKKMASRPLASSTVDDQFTAEDYKTRFPALAILKTEPKDSFKPLVYRKDVVGKNGTSTLNAIPADFAEGDSNWLYTGTAVTDGVPEALFENKSTGEGVFVQHGAHWKKAVVEQITPTTVLISGPSGTKLLQLVNEEPTEDKSATTTATPGAVSITAGATPADAGTTPVSPTVTAPMSGPIGNGGGGGGRRGRRGGGNNNGGNTAATTGGG